MARASGHTQARGLERRQRLSQAAAELLEERDLEDIALADIAAHAGIPASSAYHFYPNAHSVFAAVAEEFAGLLAEAIQVPFSRDESSSWQSIISTCVDRSVSIYANSVAFTQLILSGKAPPDIKLSDRRHDEEVGRMILSAIEQHFEVPEFPRRNDVFFYVTEIADLMFMLSVNAHGRITEEMREEAKRAAVAYLRTYLPDILHRKD